VRLVRPSPFRGLVVLGVTLSNPVKHRETGKDCSTLGILTPVERIKRSRREAARRLSCSLLNLAVLV